MVDEQSFEESKRTHNRRTSDIADLVTMRTSLAVLEKIVENHETRLSDMEDFHRSVVERFDQKIQMDTTNQIIIERTLTKAVAAIDTLSERMTAVIDLATEAGKLASKHETIGYTILRLGGWATVVISAAWAVFKTLSGS